MSKAAESALRDALIAEPEKTPCLAQLAIQLENTRVAGRSPASPRLSRPIPIGTSSGQTVFAIVRFDQAGAGHPVPLSRATSIRLDHRRAIRTIATSTNVAPNRGRRFRSQTSVARCRSAISTTDGRWINFLSGVKDALTGRIVYWRFAHPLFDY